MKIIEVKNLEKSFGTQQALKGISFSIEKGEFYGLLGPNGAGKTTTLSIISSILKPDRGEVFIQGKNNRKPTPELKKTFGVVPQEIALYEELSAYANLKFWGSLYGLPKSKLINRIDQTLDLFGLSERKNDLIRTYSGGMKRRINIAVALLHRPQILFMDEPTVGIDPQSRNLIFEVIKKLHKAGMTIVYTTHYMEEAERLCDRIGIIDDGKILVEGTLQELQNYTDSKEVISIEFDSLENTHYEALKSFWKDVERNENTLLFYTSHPKADLSPIILKCNQLKIGIQNIEIQRTNLETIFLKLTGKQLRD